MGYLLKEALKTLCGVNQWSYAGFWKIGCQNPKLLIWEECYNGLVSCSGLPTLSENGNLRSGVPAGDKVDFLVNNMMSDSNVRIIGEGLVGRVACTGNYQWMLSSNYYREPHPPEVLKEAFQQFSVGMQTVAVIPVLPHGVVQLGSHLTILENIGFVNEVVSLVLQLGHIPGILQSENHAPNNLGHQPLPLEPKSIEASCFSAQTSSMFDGQSYFQPSNPSPSQLKLKTVPKSDFSPQNQIINGASKPEVIINPFNSNLWTNQQSSSMLKNPNLSKTENYNDACTIQPPPGDDLFDILGADFKNSLFKKNELEKNSSLLAASPNFSEHINSGGLSFSGTDSLLDAVVSSKISPPSAEENSVSSCMTTLTNTGGPSALKTSLPYGRFGDVGLAKGELLFGVPKYVAKGKEDSGTFSQGSCVYDHLLGGKGQDVKRVNSMATTECSNNKAPQSGNKPNRKRLKPGDNPRPRPKDRQMIQDRVKELREIVPNSAKCSIDSLLDRTIRHMLFLQGVTKHAGNLKQTAESKIIGKDGGLLLKDNSGGGATWAYEVGSQSMVCPIIVEDLNQPHQMLVEMLCEERGLFLEIADIIRGLGLTILKGLMENRDDKVWAHFVVEANRNVTRMEIFLSLVRLLNQNETGVPQPTVHKIVREFNQAAPVQATGGPVGIC